MKTKKMVLILWGYNPNGKYGEKATKLCANASQKEKDRRRKEGFFLRECPSGELPPDSIYRFA
jgi:hypothetical protein